ncbi:MAG: hypothetical protein IMF08_13830 [Proteobacteria bacterium]|nr:hypothetical protein [Pseudomonadota bacterium]
MPLLAGLALALDAVCIIHALRARQPYYWYMIIFTLPGIGAGIYFFSEILPDLAHSRAAREAASDLGRVIDPAKEIREATGALRLSDTAENRKRLAEALCATERYDEARTLYETALEGAHAGDPALMMGLTRSLFGLKDYAGVCDTLDQLREANPDFESAEGHMLYARSREGMGDLDQAAVEFETLSGYYPGEEARCRHGLLLQRLGQVDDARATFEAVIVSVETAPKTYFRAQRDWYQVAKSNLPD